MAGRGSTQCIYLDRRGGKTGGEKCWETYETSQNGMLIEWSARKVMICCPESRRHGG